MGKKGKRNFAKRKPKNANKARESSGKVSAAALKTADRRAHNQGGGVPKSGRAIAPRDAKKTDKRISAVKKPARKLTKKPKVDEFAGYSTSKKRKVMKQEKKARRNPKFDTVVDTNKLYSNLIDTTKQERDCEGIVDQLLKRVAESPVEFAQFAQSRGGSRAVQACLKWGTLMQRRQICDKLMPELRSLATSRYGVVVAEKLFRYGDKEAVIRKRAKLKSSGKSKGENVARMVTMLTGPVLKRLAFHRSACRLLNFVYFFLTSENCKVPNAKAHQRRMLLELCLNNAGRAALNLLALSKTTVQGLPSLKDVLTRQGDTTSKIDAELHASIVSHLHEVCRKVVDKELLLYQMWHQVWALFCSVASDTQLEELADHAEEGLPLLLSSRHGAEAMIRLIGVSNAKIKRHLCRALKGQWVILAKNEVDYVVLMRLIDTVDDTVLLTKTMFAELGDEIRGLCFDKHGSKVVLHILTLDTDEKRRRRVLTPYELSQLGAPAPATKKELSLRALEICPKVSGKLRTELQTSKSVAEFASDLHARSVLVEYLIRSGDDSAAQAVLDAVGSALRRGDEVNNLHYALAALVKADKEGTLKLAEGSFTSRLWKVLLSGLDKTVGSNLLFVLKLMLDGPEGDAVRRGCREHSAVLKQGIRSRKAAGANCAEAEKFLSEIGAAAPLKAGKKRASSLPGEGKRPKKARNSV